MKLNIKGAYGDTNFGDDLLMLVFEDYFFSKFPEAKLNFEGKKGIEYPKKMLSHSTYNEMGNYDCLVYGGGTQFYSFVHKHTLKSKIKNNIKKNPIDVLKKILTKVFPSYNTDKHYTEKVFLGFGVGPFNNNESSIEFAKDRLKNSLYIGVRDKVSYRYCNEWNIKTKLGADVVFSSYFDKYLMDIPENNSFEKIGIIVRDWNWNNNATDYQEKIISYIDSHPELDITIIVFAKDIDLKWMDKIKNRKHIIWDPDTMSVIDFIKILNSFSTFVTARYHGAIITGLLGKKVVCIEIEPKLRILTEQIPSFALWENDFDNNKLHNILSLDLKNNHYDLQTFRQKADDMLNEFAEVYNIKFKNA